MAAFEISHYRLGPMLTIVDNSRLMFASGRSKISGYLRDSVLGKHVAKIGENFVNALPVVLDLVSLLGKNDGNGQVALGGAVPLLICAWHLLLICLLGD